MKNGCRQPISKESNCNEVASENGIICYEGTAAHKVAINGRDGGRVSIGPTQGRPRASAGPA